MDSRIEKGPEYHVGVEDLQEAWRERRELREMLREVEWVEFEYGFFCLFCHGAMETGHEDDCRWARMLGDDR